MRPAAILESSVALLFVLLLSPAAEDDRADTGVLRGIVTEWASKRPLPFANVILLGSRLGAMTDESGRFMISGIPSGTVQVMVRAIGYPALIDAFKIAAGETLQRTYNFATHQDTVMAAALDSLGWHGPWPPGLHPVLRQSMQSARRARVFRLDPWHPVSDPAARDSNSFVGPWPIVAEARPPGRWWRRDLLELLSSPGLHWYQSAGEKKMCGGFEPRVAVRFEEGSRVTDMTICYKCAEFVIRSSDGLYQSGDFEGEGRAFVRLARRAFPRDPIIRAIDVHHYVRTTFLRDLEPAPPPSHSEDRQR